MNKDAFSKFSKYLNRDMNYIKYGENGVPLIAFPCMEAMADGWENFGMLDSLSWFIETGKIILWCVDTTDFESYVESYRSYEDRANNLNNYYNWFIEEAYPMITSSNTTKQLPIVTGFSGGGYHCANMFFRRPDLFSGVLAISGLYDMTVMFHGWCNDVLYMNSPVSYLSGMPKNHEYIKLYNSKKMILVAGKETWTPECLKSQQEVEQILRDKGINAEVYYWHGEYDHDWPWWKEEICYYLPQMLESMN